MSKNNLRVICMGEILIDFIGSHTSPDIASTTEFKRYLGGSPANVAMNLKKLGCDAALVATIGDDGLGDFLCHEMESLQMTTQFINRAEDVPTSAILVSKTQDTPDFIAYREADCLIDRSQIKDSEINNAAIFHTTCFALSRNPARDTIMEKAKVAAAAGALISIDLNYSSKIWPNQKEALEIIKLYCSYKPMIKVSLDDVERLFGADMSINEFLTFLHEHGASLICLTRGGDGVIVSQQGQNQLDMPAIPLKKVVDVTGAGDAFWAGFLCGTLHKKSVERCVEFALKVASIKLTTIGGLPAGVDLKP